MSSQPNENCLAGYECPKCKSKEPLWFSTISWTRWTDNGTDESVDFEIMEDGGQGLCEKCSFRAPIPKFIINE